MNRCSVSALLLRRKWYSKTSRKTHTVSYRCKYGRVVSGGPARNGSPPPPWTWTRPGPENVSQIAPAARPPPAALWRPSRRYSYSMWAFSVAALYKVKQILRITRGKWIWWINNRMKYETSVLAVIRCVDRTLQGAAGQWCKFNDRCLKSRLVISSRVSVDQLSYDFRRLYLFS